MADTLCAHEKEVETLLKTYFLACALTKKEVLEAAFYRLPFEPYTPIRQQLLTILREVNRIRSRTGIQALSDLGIRYNGTSPKRQRRASKACRERK